MRDTIRVDPSVWGFGFKMRVLQYQVKGATGRLLQWQSSSKPGWVPGVGLIPRLWRDAAGDLRPQSGLSTLESGQKRSWADMMAGGSSSASSSRAASTVAAATAEEDLQQVYCAAWMRPSPLRQHPLQRAATAAAVVTAHRQQQLETQRAAAPAHSFFWQAEGHMDGSHERKQPKKSQNPWGCLAAAARATAVGGRGVACSMVSYVAGALPCTVAVVSRSAVGAAAHSRWPSPLQCISLGQA